MVWQVWRVKKKKIMVGMARKKKKKNMIVWYVYGA